MTALAAMLKGVVSHIPMSFGWGHGQVRTQDESVHMVNEYHAVYTQPAQHEVDNFGVDLDELLKTSKVVSHNPPL